MHTTRRLTLLLIPILLLSIPFLILPLFGLRSAGELKIEMVESQEDHLSQLARTLAEQISEQIKPALQKEPVQEQPAPKKPHPRLSGTMRLDGLSNDWPDDFVPQQLEYGAGGGNLSYRYYSGIQGQYLYLLFEVQDDNVIYRATDSLKLDESDHLQIIVRSGEEQKKYIAAGYKPGWIVGFRIPEDPEQIAQIEKRIHGVWKSTGYGYVLEVRIDRALLGEDVSLAIADVDNPEIRSITALLDTSGFTEQPGAEPELSQLSELVDMNQVLNAADPVPGYYRVRIIDDNLQILAETGAIDGTSDPQPSTDSANEISSINGIQQALEGRQTLVHYRSPWMADEITAAIAPVLNNDEVIALLTVERNMNHLLSPIKKLTHEATLLFITTFLLSSGGICLYLFFISRSSDTESP